MNSAPPISPADLLLPREQRRTVAFRFEAWLSGDNYTSGEVAIPSDFSQQDIDQARAALRDYLKKEWGAEHCLITIPDARKR